MSLTNDALLQLLYEKYKLGQDQLGQALAQSRPELTPELANALYEAMHGDIECNMRNGIAFVEVERAAPSLRAAINSAIQDIEGADVGVRVVRVESEAANVIAQINAALLGTPAGKSG